MIFVQKSAKKRTKIMLILGVNYVILTYGGYHKSEQNIIKAILHVGSDIATLSQRYSRYARVIFVLCTSDIRTLCELWSIFKVRLAPRFPRYARNDMRSIPYVLNRMLGGSALCASCGVF